MSIRPTGTVPVVVVDSDPLCESSAVNQYLDEAFGLPKPQPEDPEERAYARIWVALADDNFFPAVLLRASGASEGSPRRGFRRRWRT